MVIKYHSASTNKELRQPSNVHVMHHEQEQETNTGNQQEEQVQRAPQHGKIPTCPVDTPKNLIDLTTIVYALQAGSFVVPGTGIAGVVINYTKMEEVKGTWLETHFAWQIQTFWVSIIGTFIGFFLIPLFGVGILVILGVTGWFIYRIIKGWLNLSEYKAMDVRNKK